MPLFDLDSKNSTDFQLSIVIVDMHWWDLSPKSIPRFPALRIPMDMQWWDLNTKNFSMQTKFYK